jgi:hypothetical protein
VRRKLPTRLPANDIDHVGMATLKGMRDGLKRDRITFEGNKDADYSFSKIKSFIWLSENAMPYCLCHREACTGTHIFPRRVCYIQLHYRQKRGQVAPKFVVSESDPKTIRHCSIPRIGRYSEDLPGANTSTSLSTRAK